MGSLFLGALLLAWTSTAQADATSACTSIAGSVGSGGHGDIVSTAVIANASACTGSKVIYGYDSDQDLAVVSFTTSICCVTFKSGCDAACQNTHEVFDGVYRAQGSTGTNAVVDCDDTTSGRTPGKTEVVGDQIDQSCNAKDACYTDTDGDHYATDAATAVDNYLTTSTCAAQGAAKDKGDCDDTKSTTFPGAAQAESATACRADADDDGYGSTTAPSGGTAGGDCDDAKAAAFPGSAELESLTECRTDADGDGYGSTTAPAGGTAGTDCNDTVATGATVYPGRTEVVGDGVDQDCDTFEACYPDLDDDDHGATGAVASDTFATGSTCVAIASAAAVADDCDDTASTGAARTPGKTEVVNDQIDQNCNTKDACYPDVDGDGHGALAFTDVWLTTSACTVQGAVATGDDCDDSAATGATRHPGLAELIGDGVDQNCNTFDACYPDADGDDHGALAAVLSDTYATGSTCLALSNAAATADDCDDTASTGAARTPGKTEVVNDQIDQNCNTFDLCFPDVDADGFGASASTDVWSTASTCTAQGARATGTDCDDTKAKAFPGAAERESVTECRTDADDDGYGSKTAPTGGTAGTDCDDGSGVTFPGAAQLESASECRTDADDDGLGSATAPPGGSAGADCDDTASSIKGPRTFYLDVDGDGVGGSTSVSACSAPSTAYVQVTGDCDDTRPLVNPNAAEICNGVDDDCKNGIDDHLTFVTYYVDSDLDTYGNDLLSVSACADPGNSVTRAGDCDDLNDAINPGEAEICNGVDDDCRSGVDDGLTFSDWYLDGDGDGYGRSTVKQSACSSPGGYVANLTDCDDFQGSIHPSAPEVCDGIDQDCDAVPDDGLATTAYYRDGDGDTYGLDSTRRDVCAAPAGPYVTRGGDCRDDDALANPGAAEVCNGADDDCDAVIDDGVKLTFWRDVDGDTYGVSASPASACVAPVGYVTPGSVDCDDTRPTVYPGAPEVFGDNLDQNCDGTLTCYVDGDADGAYATGASTFTVPAPGTCVTVGPLQAPGDCDDRDATIRPGATDAVADGVDADCDGNETCYVDADGDGHAGRTATVSTTDVACTATGHAVTASADDCNDTPVLGAGINPGATDAVGDDVDQDCSGRMLCYLDGDGDFFGVNTPVEAPVGVRCSDQVSPTQDDAYARDLAKFDCDDSRAFINPTATETVANGVDEDCDGNDSCYPDADRDGFGGSSLVSVPADPDPSLTCSTGRGYSTTSGDCDDRDADVSPLDPELVADGIDNNCDGDYLCYKDVDGDRFGSNETLLLKTADCSGGGALNNTDCEPTENTAHPGGAEVVGNTVDENCDGFFSCFVDVDGDTYGGTTTVAVPRGEAGTYPNCTGTYNGKRLADDDFDCWDDPTTGFAVNPGRTEIAGNEFDDDCSTTADCYVDQDDDGHGVTTEIGVVSTSAMVVGTSGARGGGCATPGLTASCSAASGVCNVDDQGDDCRDDDATLAPGLPEVAGNSADENCDAKLDCYIDADKDGYGGLDGLGLPIVGTGLAVVACSGDFAWTSGVVALAIQTYDCDDANDQAYPDPTKVDLPGDAVDQDCNGKLTCYVDADHDRYGADGAPAPTIQFTTVAGQRDCDGHLVPTTTIFTAAKLGDCDDTQATIFVGAPEAVADGVDANCDGVDVCWRDADDDGYGSTVTVLSPDLSCVHDFMVADNTRSDCDDGHAERFPGATEIPANGTDEDCNEREVCWFDKDSDGFAGTELKEDTTHRVTFETPRAELWCDVAPLHRSSEDCYDCEVCAAGPAACTAVELAACKNANPSTTTSEKPADGIDQNCDTKELCYVDLDADRDGDAKPGVVVESPDLSCSDDGESPSNGDCNDGDPRLSSIDSDGDGSASCDAVPDCAPVDPSIGPLNGETCEASGNQFDSDCDGDPNTEWVITCTTDGAGVRTCTAPSRAIGSRPVADGPGDRLYPDVDHDGFGDENDPGFLGCAPTADYVTNKLDCNDREPRIYYGAPETCDGVDENCNRRVDEYEALDPDGSRCSPLFRDKDLDGTGDPSKGLCLCPETSSGTSYVGGLRGTYLGEVYVEANTDCDDSRADIRPHQCIDGIDNDGDGQTDASDPRCQGDPVVASVPLEDASAPAEVRVDLLDGHDNDCDGLITLLEVDCDDDGSFPYFTQSDPIAFVTRADDVFTTHDAPADLGASGEPWTPSTPLVACAAGDKAPKVSCWGKDLVVECDLRSGLWAFRYTAGDGYDGRFTGGVRNLVQGDCAATSDCDDNCPSRCPGEAESCDGVDNDCDGLLPRGFVLDVSVDPASGATDELLVVDEHGADDGGPDGVPDQLQPALVDVGHVSLAEVDIDGDRFVSCEEDFALGLAEAQPAQSSCAPLAEDVGLSDCNPLCYLTSPAGVEVCDGFLDTCGTTTIDGRDHDDDGFSTCGALGDPTSELAEQIFLPVWVSCGRFDGALLSPDCPKDDSGPTPAVSDPYVPLIAPRPSADADGGVLDLDAYLAETLGKLGHAPIGPTTKSPVLVDLICGGTAADTEGVLARTGGICTTVALTLRADIEGESPPEGDPELPADAGEKASNWSVRTVWEPDRILEARGGVTEYECLRLFGKACADVDGATPRIAEGAPPGIDERVLADQAWWWIEVGRFTPTSLLGAVVSCWGDPFGGAPIGGEVGGDCDDSDPTTNRDSPEGPGDVLAENAENPFDCARCLDQLDNNCDGLIDCADPTCDVCFVGQGQGCAGGHDACAEPGEGGCSTGESGGLLVLLAPLLGLRRRRREPGVDGASARQGAGSGAS